MASLTQRLDSLDGERRRYTLETLAGHVAAAGQQDRLQSLFANSDWMDARVRSGGFRYDGYLEDVAIAFGSARGLAGADEASLVRVFRLALISSTVTTLSGSVPVDLVAEAVKRSTWPAARAIGLAATMESSLDQQALCWKLLDFDHLADSEREEVQDLLDSAARARGAGSFEYWTEMRRSMDKIRGRWVARDVVERSLALLCAVETSLTVALRVGDRVLEPPVAGRHHRAEDDEIRAARESLAKTAPGQARTIVLSKLSHLRTRAGRGFEAIRSAPSFSDAERAEAAALLTFALEPSAPTLGVRKRMLKKRARLLDADTVVRISGSLTASQSRTLVEAVLHSRAQVKRYKGNPSRARALAALARRLPAEEQRTSYSEALAELMRLVDTAKTKPKKRKDVPEWRGWAMDVADPDGGEGESVVVFFDDHAAGDEGIDVLFMNYVEDLSDLEAEYDGFGAAVEALAEVVAQDDLLEVLGLAVCPFRDYGWVCVRAICALERRMTGQLAEVRDDTLERSLETLARLPEELRRDHWRRLAPVLNDVRLERALEEHRAVHDETARARAFTALTPRLGVEFRRRAAEEHLKWAQQLEESERTLRALAAVAPLLDETIEDQAIKLALTLGLAADCMKAVALLSPHLTEYRRAGAVEEAYKRACRALPDNDYEDAQLVEAWAALMPFLKPEQCSEALEEAAGLVVEQPLPSDFKRGVRLLGPFLTMAAVERLEGYQWQIPKELLLLVHSCAGHLLSHVEQSELLDQIDTLPAAKDRLDCLAQLVPHLSHELRTRGADAAWDIAVAAEDSLSASIVAEWVSTDRMASTLTAVDYSTLWALQLVSAIADYLTSGPLVTVLTLTADVPNRLDFLTKLMGNLDDSGRADAVRLATSVTDREQRSSATLPLLPFMDAQTRRETIADRLAILRNRSRSEVLAACAEQTIAGAFSDEAVAMIADDIVDICQDWHWL